MKNARIFIIVGMCLTFYLIYPIVLGIIILKKLDETKNVDELKNWSVICILFVSLIGGILMLNLNNSDLENNVSLNKRASIESEAFVMLKRLKQLKDDNILNEQEYKELRKKYVEEL